MKQDIPHGKNLKLAGIFILGVICIITMSFLWKLTQLIAHSRFDGQHEFSLEIESNPIKIAYFIPENHTLTILSLKKQVPEKSIKKVIEIPIDAHIIAKTAESVPFVLMDSIIHFRKNADINIIDKIKLWLFLQSVHADSISESATDIPITDDTFLTVISKMFVDKTLYQEAKTVLIMNATGESGFGSRLARQLTNIGSNVIMVSTAQEIQERTAITYTGDFSYTNKRIEEIVNTKSQLSVKKPVIADIIITIGKDKIDTEEF